MIIYNIFKEEHSTLIISCIIMADISITIYEHICTYTNTLVEP